MEGHATDLAGAMCGWLADAKRHMACMLRWTNQPMGLHRVTACPSTPRYVRIVGSQTGTSYATCAEAMGSHGCHPAKSACMPWSPMQLGMMQPAVPTRACWHGVACCTHPCQPMRTGMRMAHELGPCTAAHLKALKLVQCQHPGSASLNSLTLVAPKTTKRPTSAVYSGPTNTENPISETC